MRFEYYTRPLVIFAFILCVLIYLLTPFFLNKSKPKNFGSDFCGYVISYPYKTNKGYYFQIKNEEGKFAAITYSNYELSLYEYVCVKGKILEIESNDYFGNFSWKKYMNLKNIFWQIDCSELRSVKSAPWIFKIASSIRYKFKYNLEKFFDRNIYSVIEGLVIGEKQDLSQYLKDAVIKCGIAHLMVASGSNLSYFMAFAFVILSLFRVNLKIKYIASAFLGFFYTLTIGFDPPIMRAYIMIVFYLAGYFLKRNTDPFHLLAAVFSFMLIIDPLYIYDTSFIMSFLCVYGITVGFMNWGWVLDRFNFIDSKYKKSDIPIRIFLRKILKGMAIVIMVTLFSQMMLLPYIAVNFHRFSLISFVSNTVLIPFSSIIIGISTVWSFLINIFDFTFFRYILEKSVLLFIKVIFYFSSFKYSLVYFSLPNTISVLTTTAVIVIILHLPVFNLSNPVSKTVLSSVFIFFLVSVTFKDTVKEDIILEINGKKIYYIERYGKYYMIDPVIDPEKLINTVYASRRNRIDYILISSYSSFRKKTVEKLLNVFDIKKVYMPLWICYEEISNSHCLFGGDYGEGFKSQFYERYGYFDTYSKLKYCFEDKCF